MSELLTRFHMDASERTLTVENVQDVEDIVETNKVLQSEAQKSDWGRMIARVPEVVIVDWLNKEYERGNVNLRYLGPGFDEWFAKKVKDPDNRAWRTDNPSNPFHVGYGT